MKKKYLAIAALSMALAGGSAMTSFAAGFVHTSQGTKYQWGSGDYCTNNWVNYKNHWFFFGEDQITVSASFIFISPTAGNSSTRRSYT